MTRRAAGRADGRPPRRIRYEAGRRLATVLVAGLVTVLPVVLAPPPAAAAPGGGALDGGRPVHIAVGQLEPRTVTPGSTIVLSGTLVNDSDDTFTDLAVRLQRGEVLATRRALAADLTEPGQANAATGPFRPVPGKLDPGDSLSFTYPVAAADLGLAAAGVYPALVNVNGTREGGQAERVGELATYLVAQPAAPVSRTTVAWLWPFIDRPHRDATGAFTDDDLAAEVAADGRLQRALATVEQLPPGPGEDGAGAVPVTLAVDPALLEELATMAAGQYTVDGDAGTGTADAADFLDRLRLVSAVHPVVALSYGDVDADAVVSVGQAAVLTRSLPGTPLGTAHQPVDGAGTATATPAAPTPSAPAAGAPTPSPPTPGAPTSAGTDAGGDAGDTGTGDTGTGGTGAGAGAAIVRRVLGVAPRTDIAWPAGGTVRTDTLGVLADGGVSAVVLAEAGLTDSARLVGGTRGTRGTLATAHVDLTTAAGPRSALVADDALGRAVAEAAAGTTGARLAEQRYLAELGVLTTQLARVRPGAAQTVLVVPPRQVDADPEWAGAMMGDTVTQPWLDATSVPDLASTPGADGFQVAAGPGSPLPMEGLAEIADTAAVRDDFAAAVPNDPATVLAGYDAAISRTASAAWRGDPVRFTAAARNLGRTVAQLRDQVTLLAPADGTYSLASSDAPLVLTVQNDLPFAVDVRLDLGTRGNVGLTTDDIGVQTLEPQSRTTLQVPAHVRQSGTFAVTAVLTTPAGGPLGEAVRIQVKSTAYGTVTLVITIGAAGLLGLLFLRRLVRFLVRRRRGTPPVEDAAADPLSAPPVRSPV